MKEERKIEISYQDADLIFHCVFRYALGRMTYIVSDVADSIERNWANIPPKSQQLILKELKEEIGRYEEQVERESKFPCLGMDCDYRTWESLYQKIKPSELPT